MPLMDAIVYGACLILVGFLGSLFVHVVDKKSDKMLLH